MGIPTSPAPGFDKDLLLSPKRCKIDGVLDKKRDVSNLLLKGKTDI